MKSLSKLAVIMSAVALVSCGGGGGSDAPTATVASANTTVAVNPTTGPAAIQAVAATPLPFAAGVPAFGTTGTATNLTINAGATPTFAVAAGGKTATGNFKFGSCIFEVTNSTFTPPSTLLTGATVTVPNCDINLQTANAAATGAPVSISVTVSLNGTASGAITQTMAISPSGVITINGTTVTVTPVKTGTGTV